MSASVTTPEVAAFVAAVRRELSDLAPDEIDELTGGLEADLDDALADAETGAEPSVQRFGTPAAYAAELRAAAGLPPRADGGGRLGAGLVPTIRSVRSQGISWLGGQFWWAPLRDFLLILRPVWWFGRAGLLAMVLLHAAQAYRGVTVTTLVAFGVVLIVSIEAGRRAWARRNPLTRLAVLGVNLVALLALPMGLSASIVPDMSYSSYEVPPANGLWLNGTEVRNVLPYDSSGRPLTDVQLYDENGNPLTVGDSAHEAIPDPATSQDTGTTLFQQQVPAVDERGMPVWNVFPLRQQELTATCCDSNGDEQREPLAAPTAAALPRATQGRVSPPVFARPAAASSASSPAVSSGSSSVASSSTPPSATGSAHATSTP